MDSVKVKKEIACEMAIYITKKNKAEEGLGSADLRQERLQFKPERSWKASLRRGHQYLKECIQLWGRLLS